MRKLLLLGVLAGLMLAANAGTASATTFDGTCDVVGTVKFQRPFGLIIDNNNAEITAKGTCKGTVDGQAFDGPVWVYVDERNMNKPMSCEFGISDQNPAWISFGQPPDRVDATILNMFITESHVGQELPVDMEGAYNGHAVGAMNYHVTNDTIQQCIDGTAEGIDFDLHGQTIGPLYG
jgi:hypothetical protein